MLAKQSAYPARLQTFGGRGGGEAKENWVQFTVEYTNSNTRLILILTTTKTLSTSN